MTHRLMLASCTLFLLLGGGLLLAAPAAAHATVVSSDPADGARLRQAPRTVRITFDESVGLGDVGYLHVTDGSGARVDARGAYHPGGDGSVVADDLRAGLRDGSYTASYRVISADSHPVAGAIAFVVGNGTLVRADTNSANDVNGLTSATFDVVRWVSYAGLALVGAAWLLFTIWPAGRAERRARRIVWTGLLATAAGAVLEALVQGPFSAGSGLGRLFDSGLIDGTLHTDYGVLHVARLVLLAGVAGVFGCALRPGAAARRWGSCAAVLGIGVCATFAGTGHASSTSPAWVSTPFDVLHLLAMAVWLGGLVMLLRALLPRRDPDELRAVLPVFSSVAFGCVITLAVTGSYAAWRGIGTAHAIFATTYGLLVVAKIVLFCALLALGNLSRLSVRRRTVAFAMVDGAVLETEDDVAARQSRLQTERLRRSVFVEMLVAVIVLAVTAVLVAEPRGKEAVAASYQERSVSGDAPLGGGRSVTVTADPAVHGLVDITVVVHGAPRATVTATATQQRAQIGPLPVQLVGHGGGHFDGTVTLPAAGPWDFDLIVTTSVFDATTTDLTLDLH